MYFEIQPTGFAYGLDVGYESRMTPAFLARAAESMGLLSFEMGKTVGGTILRSSLGHVSYGGSLLLQLLFSNHTPLTSQVRALLFRK